MISKCDKSLNSDIHAKVPNVWYVQKDNVDNTLAKIITKSQNNYV